MFVSAARVGERCWVGGTAVVALEKRATHRGKGVYNELGWQLRVGRKWSLVEAPEVYLCWILVEIRLVHLALITNVMRD